MENRLSAPLCTNFGGNASDCGLGVRVRAISEISEDTEPQEERQPYAKKETTCPSYNPVWKSDRIQMHRVQQNILRVVTGRDRSHGLLSARGYQECLSSPHMRRAHELAYECSSPVVRNPLQLFGVFYESG